MTKIFAYTALALLLPLSAQAAPNETELEVWANEAIVSTYSYNFKNFLQRQKEIAKYFTAKGWTDFSTVFIASKIPEAVKTNSYFVSAVATLPPQIKALGPNKWQAKMPLLVVYQNPQYQQKQSLDVSINFVEVPSGEGIRGLAITSLQAKAISPTCKCDISTTENESTQPQDAK